jgi:NAD-dependent DNA ligase
MTETEKEKKEIIKKKRKTIKIISSSSSQGSKKEVTKKKREPKEKKETKKKREKKEINKTKTKKKKITILSSSSTKPLTKEKIDSLLSQKTTITQEILPSETELKILSQDTIMSTRLNEKFIELLEKLAEIMLKQGEPFRARAYQKAQETIMSYPNDILNPNDLKGLPNIGPTIMEKLNEYVETGTLKVLEREKNNPVNILGEIYGIGPKKAKELVEKGITNIEQLRENQNLLNDVQKIGLKYYEDVLKRIPRNEIDNYKDIIGEVVKKSAIGETRFEIVGSYRRGVAVSGDIDVIITSESEQTFKNIIDELIKTGIILEVLSRGPSKCLVMAKIPSSDSVRRVDFLYTSLEEFPFAILYFTGSKIFNTVMRHQALTMGLSMNEHGLYTLQEDNKKKGEKVDHKFTSEKDIFDYLNMEYKNPEERIDGRAVIVKPKLKIDTNLQELKEEVKAPLAPKASRAKTLKKLKPEKKVQQKEAKISEAKISEAKISEAKISEAKEKEENIIIDTNAKDLIETFKKNGIKTLEQLNEKQLTDMLNLANIHYRNLEPIMTDNEFDILQDYISEKYPTNNAIHQIGAPVEKNKVELPYFMGSMDKIKPDTNALNTWKLKYKGPYVLSCKLDGVSGLYTTEGSKPKLYTRGDGKIGQDISYLIPYLRLPKNKGIVIRGEFIIPKSIFESKYKSKFANPRNMVSGIVNHKSINETINDVNFVSYELLKPIKKPSEQMEYLQSLDINVVLYKIADSDTLTNELLSDTLVEWRKNYAYEIDGVIVTDDAIYERKIGGNPDYAFAFKMVLSDQIAEAKVIDVIWTASKDGYLKPRVQIEPINLGGVRIEYATGFNGSFIHDNKVGIGAVIELIRSGDVIPHIRKVTMPATEAKMPSVPYKWNDTHVDVLLEDIGSDETVKEKVITGFFKGLNVEGLSSGNVARIIHAGYDNVPAILKMTKDDLLKVEGFKEKTATKLYNGIREKIDAAPLLTIMSASNLFGRGFSEKKLELIINEYPDVLVSKETPEQKIEKIAAIKGMARKTAEAFVERIPQFIQFLKEANLEEKLHSKNIENKLVVVDQSHPLYNKTIVMTGFRDQDLQDKLKSVGAKLGSSVSKNTFVVIVKDVTEDTGKVLDAKKIGVPIMTIEEFKEKYL